jgi:hypothetical protein
VFIVSVASKGLNYRANPLESILMRSQASIDSKRVIALSSTHRLGNPLDRGVKLGGGPEQVKASMEKQAKKEKRQRGCRTPKRNIPEN